MLFEQILQPNALALPLNLFSSHQLTLLCPMLLINLFRSAFAYPSVFLFSSFEGGENREREGKGGKKERGGSN